MKRKILSMLLTIGLLLTQLPLIAQATDTIIYVSETGTGDGSSWDNATSLDAAWATASAGTKIFVKAGTYNRTSTLTLKDGVSVYGGFAGTETSESERARSDVDGNGIVEPWEFTNASILTGTKRLFAGTKNAAALVDGFTMTTTASTGDGAVIQLFPGNTLQNSVVTNSNNASRGVILVDGGSLLSSYIHNNVSNSDRGCIYVYYTYDSPSCVKGCRIENNKSQHGGGIYSRVPYYQVDIINNLIVNNEATIRGGGVYLGSGSGTPANAWLINNTIVNNTVSYAPYYEGGNGDGSGVFAEGGVYVYNNVITGNTGPEGCQQIANSNKGGNFHFKNNAIENLEGIDWTAASGTVVNENNISLDGTETLFDVDYVPTLDSVLVSAGDKTLYPGYVVDSPALKDLKGAARVQGGQIDIGAYEYHSPPVDPQLALNGKIVPYDGLTHSLTATTVPAGLPVTYTYNGSAAAPSEIGVYTVLATVDCTKDDIYYYGTAEATLDIRTARTITATAGENGTITPSGAVLVADGLSQSFTITPNTGYLVDTVEVDGVEATLTNGSYTFENVTEDHTIDVTFKQGYALTIKADAGGSITTGADGLYAEGAVINIAATANSGYVFSKWTTSGGGTFGSETSASTTFEMPAEAVTITATFVYAGGGGGGGGGGGAPAPAQQADISGSSMSGTKLSLNVNTNTGNAKASLNSSVANAILGSGGKALITVPAISGVDTYTLGLPASSLTGSQGEGSLTFSTDVGSIEIPGNMLEGISGTEGKEAAITIGHGDKSSLPADIRASIGDKPLVSLTLTLGGVQTEWNNPDAPVTVTIPYTPTAQELANPESIVIWYIDGSGNAVSVPNGHYDPVTGTVTFATTHFSLYAVAYIKVIFNDVAANAWYNKAVSFIAARGITTGTGGGKFSPNANITRGEFLVMLMRAYEIAPDANWTDNFADAGNSYYTGYLAKAKKMGISSGVGNNMFEPNREITRQEMFVLLYNALKSIDKLPEGLLGITLSNFKDAGDIASWAKDAISLLVQTGTISGSDGMLFPLKTSTRAEMAQVLYNLLSK